MHARAGRKHTCGRVHVHVSLRIDTLGPTTSESVPYHARASRRLIAGNSCRRVLRLRVILLTACELAMRHGNSLPAQAASRGLSPV